MCDPKWFRMQLTILPSHLQVKPHRATDSNRQTGAVTRRTSLTAHWALIHMLPCDVAHPGILLPLVCPHSCLRAWGCPSPPSTCQSLPRSGGTLEQATAGCASKRTPWSHVPPARKVGTAPGVPACLTEGCGPEVGVVLLWWCWCARWSQVVKDFPLGPVGHSRSKPRACWQPGCQRWQQSGTTKARLVFEIRAPGTNLCDLKPVFLLL